MFKVLHHDPDLIAIDKPSGFQVHPHEDSQHRLNPNTNVLLQLKKQVKQHLYPVHRLDRATSGVLIFALNPEMARELSGLFQRHEITKTYYAVTRGWLPLLANPETESEINHPLSPNPDVKSPPEKHVPALTHYTSLTHLELPHQTHPLFNTSRYSLVRVTPKTGRTHQIRRHFAHLSHPLIGDSIYGETKHNRLFKDTYGIEGLLLRAYSLSFTHPRSHTPVTLTARWPHTWHQVFDLFGQCPFNRLAPRHSFE